MINRKVLNMTMGLMVEPRMTKRKDPVTIDEINDLLDEAAEESVVDNQDQEETLGGDTVPTIGELAEESSESSNDAQPEAVSASVDESVEIPEAATSPMDGVAATMNEVQNTYYPIEKGAICAHCKRAIQPGDIIQIDGKGDVNHSECKHDWGAYSLEVVTPTTESVVLFGESIPTSMVGERGLQLASLKYDADPSLRGAINLAKFIYSYSAYVSKLNKADLKKAEAAKDKDSKSNIIKIKDKK